MFIGTPKAQIQTVTKTIQRDMNRCPCVKRKNSGNSEIVYRRYATKFRMSSLNSYEADFLNSYKSDFLTHNC